MATSGTFTFNQTRNEIIKDALIKLNVVDIEEDSIASNYQSTAERALNRLLKSWQTKYVGLWTVKEATLFLELSENRYSLGSTGDHATKSYLRTQVATAAVSGASAVIVDSTSGMTAADNVGVQLDDGTLQWFTIASKAGTTINLSGGTLNDDVAVDNYVYTYTTKITRPLRILSMRRMDVDYNETPLQALNHVEYYELPRKTDTGFATMYFYDKQLDNGQLNIWPATNDVTEVLKFTFQEPIMDIDAATQNAELPSEWLDALVFNLALMLVPDFNAYAILEKLVPFAQQTLTDAQNFDTEDASICISPSTQGIVRGYR